MGLELANKSAESKAESLNKLLMHDDVAAGIPNPIDKNSKTTVVTSSTWVTCLDRKYGCSPFNFILVYNQVVFIGQRANFIIGSFKTI